MDAFAGLLTGCALIAAVIAVTAQWKDHAKGHGVGTFGGGMIVNHLWLLSSLFAGGALGAGSTEVSTVNRWVMGIVTTLVLYAVTWLVRPLIGQVAERFKKAEPERLVKLFNVPAEDIARVRELMSDGRKTSRKPSANALYFQTSRNAGKSDLILMGLGFAGMAFVLGSHAVTYIFPLMSPRYDIGIAIALFMSLGYYRYLYPRWLKSKLASVCIVETHGIHIPWGGGLVFLPWAAIVAEGLGGGKMGVNLTMKYRERLGYPRYSPFPSPRKFEDPQGFIAAIYRFAPVNNPLRVYTETWYGKNALAGFLGKSNPKRERALLMIAVFALLVAALAYLYWFEMK
jgi:hypothetical protein